MLLEVALPVPIPRTFTYSSDRPVEPGTRVRVGFGRRALTGWVMGESTDTSVAKLRAIDAILEDQPSVPAEVLHLCRWIADYYFAPVGQVVRAALPVVLAGGKRSEDPVKHRRVVRLTEELPSLQQREERFGRAQRQRELYEAIESIGGSADATHVVNQLGFSHALIAGLVKRGLAELIEEEVDRDPFASAPTGLVQTFQPTPAQASALTQLVAAAQDRTKPALPFLLHGVTGSGKTLVYIELLREVLRQGRGAIVLVPEIALTPQTVARFRAHFGETIAVLHSALSDGERFDAWRALHRGERRIAIGARSAIFAPVADLGAIVVDEEHEASYKQGEAPRYHAREVAVMRARSTNAVCVLGSATPSIESWYNASTGKYNLIELPERVEGRPLPPVRIVDLRRNAADSGPALAPVPATRPKVPPAPTNASTPPSTPASPPASVPASTSALTSASTPASTAASTRASTSASRAPTERAPTPILSEPLVEAIHERLARGEQSILLLNRRGYSTFVQCRMCGDVKQCRQCNVSLTFHRSRRRLVCHYCFHEEPPPVACSACGSGDLSFRGVGTEQVEREVGDTFPAARIARMDVDTTSAKWAHHEILTRVENREVDILLGTQMIAKGLDFPFVTLVGVINADVAMNLPDFRASERTFQLLTQVAGRAGRGERGGEVIIQTALPKHHAIRAAITHDYHAFAERELADRADPRYPPHVRLINVVVSGTDEFAVQEEAERAATWLRDQIAAAGIPVSITGPAPAPIDRIRGRWRWHLLLRAERPGFIAAAGRLLFTQYAPSTRAELRLILDRDPVTLL